MQTIVQTFVALISLDLFGGVLPPGGWPSTEDCPEDAICCYYGTGDGGEA